MFSSHPLPALLVVGMLLALISLTGADWISDVVHLLRAHTYLYFLWQEYGAPRLPLVWLAHHPGWLERAVPCDCDSFQARSRRHRCHQVWRSCAMGQSSQVLAGMAFGFLPEIPLL